MLCGTRVENGDGEGGFSMRNSLYLFMRGKNVKATDKIVLAIFVSLEIVEQTLRM